MKKILIIIAFAILTLFTIPKNNISCAACDATTCTGQTACMLNGTSCQTQGFTCSNSTTVCGGAASTPCCVSEWSLGSSCPASSCGSTPAPSPTAPAGNCNSSTCTGQTGCSLNGSTCQTQGYTCSNSTTTCGGAANTPCCVSEWALGSTCAASSCGVGGTPTPTPGGGGAGSYACYTGCGSCGKSCVADANACASIGGSGSCQACGGGGGGNFCGDGICTETCSTCPSDCGTCPTPIPTTYTVTGGVFVDTNKNGTKDAGESYYPGSITITTTKGSITYTNSGNGLNNYIVSGATAGQLTISYTSLPAGYQITKPVNGPPPSYTVTVGTSACSPGASNGNCDLNGNIVGVDFGITNLTPWIQTTGGDILMDSGYSYDIPSSALSSCGGAYASASSSSTDPGIVNSGNSTAFYGSGGPSSKLWQVTSPAGDNYAPPNPQTIRTSYKYILSNAEQSNNTINDFSTACVGGITSNCTLIANLPSGIYQNTGNVILSNPTIPSGGKYIFLIDGNFTLNSNLTVPQGSFLMISTTGNITIGSDVTRADGIFSADQSFTVAGVNNCSIQADVPLTINGSVIVNAALLGASFQSQRDLCTGNNCPAVSIVQRSDMILNSPSITRVPNSVWKEIAP